MATLAPSVSVNEGVTPPTITIGLNGKSAQANLPNGASKTTHVFTDLETYKSVLAAIPDGVEFDFGIYYSGIIEEGNFPTVAFGMTGKRNNYGNNEPSTIIGGGYGIVRVNNDWRYALFPKATFDDETKTLRFTYRYTALYNNTNPSILTETFSIEDFRYYNLVKGYVVY